MPRYIDADIAIKLIKMDALLYFGYSKTDAIYCIKATPTADVIPRAEVETLKDNNEHLAVILEETKIELKAMRGAANSYKMHYENLATEIFEEIEKVIGEQYENYVFDNLDIEGVKQDAIIAFVDTMKYRFAELKKKRLGG